MHPQDHFSTVAGDYAAFRPRYPHSLYDWLARIAPGHDAAWDCACGSGQAAVDLATHFSRVVATDLSATQIRQAEPHPRIEYGVALADASGLPAASVDVVTVAQALHWLDLGPLYAEVFRVLRPGGVFAAWSYGNCHCTQDAVDAVLQDFYGHIVGPYWPPARRHVDSGYRTLPFPQPELAAPALTMQQDWPLDVLIGYARSWSASARYAREREADPAALLHDALRPLWGDPQSPQTVSWPLSIRAVRRPTTGAW